MGGGEGSSGAGRKPRNFATFRLFPRSGAADPNDRVFVRVDNNAYSVPGFGDEDAYDPSLPPTDAADHFSPDASGALPDHVRREILELGLPDDGYNYLLHLRELRPSAAAAASSLVPSSITRPEPIPLDVKAYDASRVRIASSKVEDELDHGKTMCKVAAKTAPVIRVERAVDPDVARLLDESDVSHGGSENEGLEEDFVIMANQAEGDEEVEDEDKEDEGCGVFSDLEDNELEDEEGEPKQRVRRLLDEQFDLLALEEYGDSDDDRGVRHGEYELPTEVIDELKLFHNQNGCVDEEYRTPADFVRRRLDSSTAEEVDESANVIQKCAEYAERYFNEAAEVKEEVFVSESSDESEVWDCETIVSTYSNLDNHPGKIQTPENSEKRLPKVFPGETAEMKDIIKLQGKEKLPVDYLPQRKRKSKEKKAKPAEDLSTDIFVEKGAQKETKEEKKARKVALKKEKREARKAKKELKGLYKSETLKAQRVAAVTGPSSIRLM